MATGTLLGGRPCRDQHGSTAGLEEERLRDLEGFAAVASMAERDVLEGELELVHEQGEVGVRPEP